MEKAGRRADNAAPGEAEILRAADISDRTKLKEAEEGTFLKMFIKYLEKKQ